MPPFRTKKEAFEWLRTGKKTIDIRKGNPLHGNIAVYLCGRNVLKMKIVKRETGILKDVISLDNYRRVIPSAVTLDDAVAYVSKLYSGSEGIFTSYHITPLEV